MSMGSSWQVFSNATPPERGAFPLDIHGDCANVVRDYIACMRTNKGESRHCRELTQLYLKCRMDKGLMEQDDMSNLGFSDAANRWAAGRARVSPPKAPSAPSAPSTPTQLPHIVFNSIHSIVVGSSAL
ncbi:hypothetical protein BC831DRAFT_452964 [Entophlyctis helioformis]|nr:hypothetical protein BC831DRAFT_452964 [Entophlyctis helioformis]